MCSFLVTNKKIDNLDKINCLLSKRGPDNTTVVKEDNITFIHNLLHITGKKTLQPLVENSNIFLFNGEAYNFCGDSDTKFVFNGILNNGIEYCKQIDGEFAIVCKIGSEIYIASDAFGTKPIFTSKEGEFFGICSFYQPLLDLGFKKICKRRPNEIAEVYSEKIRKIYQFNLEQNQDTYEYWEKAFLEAVDKRINDNSFLCISSGYDSGAIALAAKILNKKIKMYSIKTNENAEVLLKRINILEDIEFIEIDSLSFTKHNNIINRFCDTYRFDDYDFKTDKASVGLSVIFEKAKKDGYKICLSGAGADEILSDYGINGRSVFFKDKSCTLKGKFPEKLEEVFPWYNFYSGRQERYLYKEEMVASYYGFETRYPFLDVNCVQKFLNLKNNLKNKEYKAPIAQFFDKYNFPYEKNIKRGFNP